MPKCCKCRQAEADHFGRWCGPCWRKFSLPTLLAAWKRLCRLTPGP
jgi:hypothetical protein